ncbi:hypothetical protein D3C73_1476680 [compost metagenome]
MERIALDVAVVDAVVEVAGVVVRGDQVDPVRAVADIAGVTVDVADFGAGEELAAVAPGAAVVLGNHQCGVVVDGADKIVDPAFGA